MMGFFIQGLVLGKLNLPPVFASPDKSGLRPQLSPKLRGTVETGGSEGVPDETGGSFIERVIRQLTDTFSTLKRVMPSLKVRA